ncbi:LysR family transcriptional regulator [Pelagibius sp.]|uniref:LysR family transcriptional regulator n=1 Tax=Pelagibius sp. TaxID=1931238 RepID=UPI003BAFD22F
MSDLNALVIFAKVVEAGSFSEAARRIAMPISTVSRRIAELEDQLGVRLLERSTRSLRLTDVGSEVLEQAQRSVEVSDAVKSIVSNQLSDVYGLLRLSAPPSISDSVLTPIVTAFQASYPNVRAQILVTDRRVDHLSEGVDVVFRIGEQKDSALISRRVLQYRHRLVASPDYIANCNPIRKPKDLLEHKLFAFSFWRPQHSWTFVNGGKNETITFEPSLSMNDFAGLAAALVAGSGIGDLPPIVLPHLVRDGQLVEVMPKWRFQTMDLNLVHMGNRHVPRVVRVFKEFAAQMAPQLFNDLPT